MNRNILIFGGLLLILPLGIYIAVQGLHVADKPKTVAVRGKIIKIEIADSPEERQKGLSRRKSLPQDSGMYFTFDKDDTYSFWMKDMQFPLDIVFLKDRKVVTIFHDTPAYISDGKAKIQNMTLYTPSSPINSVLEINAGQAKKVGLKEGDEIKLNL